MSENTDRAISDIRDERQRQISKEGYTLSHDDEHGDGSLAMAAALYATPTLLYGYEELADRHQFKDMWPWDWRYDKRPHSGNMLLHTCDGEGGIFAATYDLFAPTCEAIEKAFGWGKSQETPSRD